MAYTTNQLISAAYYASGVVSREFETVSGGQVADGLGWLNDILTEKRVDNGMVPYETRFMFNSQVAQETYFIPNLIKIDTLVFYLDEVRYAMQYTKRNQYFGSPRVQNIQTLPYEWYFERKAGGGNLHIYFTPDRNYPMEAHGSFDIPPVALGQDLQAVNVTADLGVPTFYNSIQGITDGVLYGIAELAPGQLVISTPSVSKLNSVDLAGTYQSIGALINYINSGILPGVMARLDVNNFVLFSTTEAPTPIYVQSSGYPTVGVQTGTNFIGNVAAATTANIPSTYDNEALGDGATLTALAPDVPLIVDGYTVQLNNRILVKDQTDPTQNGSYILSQQDAVGLPWILTRTTNYDTPEQIGIGNLFTVTGGGDDNLFLTFVQTADVSLIGTSPITFIPFGAITFSNFSTINNSNYQVFNSIGFDEFYITYLRYCLADRICSEYAYETPPNVLKQLSKYEGWIDKKSNLIDLRMKKQSTLQIRGGYNWAWVNLGKGWTPY